MNDFQNIGIFLQLTAMIILLSKIMGTLDCIGISGRTQLLYGLVFTTRFLDLPYELTVSLPSFILKIVYLAVAYLTIIFIFIVCRKTYEPEYDTFRIDLLVGACTLLSLLSTYKNWRLLAICWHFSLYLEAFAILPQIQFTAKTRYVGSSLVFYVGMLACYRGFFVVHWAYQLLAEGHRPEGVNARVALAGVVQFLTLLVYFFWMIPIFRARYAHLKIISAEVAAVGQRHQHRQHHQQHQHQRATLVNKSDAATTTATAAAVNMQHNQMNGAEISSGHQGDDAAATTLNNN